MDHDLTAWRGAVVTDVFYEFGSGLEQKRSFVYVEVPAGQGMYVWIDYNGDGIKDLNEFELANFGYEANYIRVFTQTNEFVRTYSSQLSASIDVRPATVWSEKIAAVIAVLYFTNILTDTRGIVLMVFAGIFTLTSLVGFCPL